MQIEPDTSKESIGDRLLAVRTARSWNQIMLAEALGISPQRWNNYETGKAVPPPDILAKVWQVTGATSDFILFGRYDGMPYELAQSVREAIEGLERRELRRAPAVRRR